MYSDDTYAAYVGADVDCYAGGVVSACEVLGEAVYAGSGIEAYVADSGLVWNSLAVDFG